ncbi:hypothetical protein BGZ60DRAFT_403249 [Tricladium varicosporioides]|nr:hypothetical protein BGZ60DRAFT_403249 [Hymenoscyphus varicosporioides]
MSQPNTPDLIASQLSSDPSGGPSAQHPSMAQQASQQVSTTPIPPPTPLSLSLPQAVQAQLQAPTPLSDATRDVVMSDIPSDRPASPAPAIGLTNAPSPIPPRVGTPGRNTNGTDANVTSRATSQHPDPAPAIPKEAPPHGAPTRQYLNGKVTGVLLEGMKIIAKEQPRDPLRTLGEYLLQRSKEIEGS